MRYLIIIGIFALWLVGLLPAVWAVPLLFAYALIARLPRGKRGPTPRRGGYIHPPSNASASASPGTVERVATYTGSSRTFGSPWAGRTAFSPLADLSRTIAPGFSTSVTGGNPGHPTMVVREPIVFDFRKPPDCGCGDTAA